MAYPRLRGGGSRRGGRAFQVVNGSDNGMEITDFATEILQVITDSVLEIRTTSSNLTGQSDIRFELPQVSDCIINARTCEVQIPLHSVQSILSVNCLVNEISKRGNYEVDVSIELKSNGGLQISLIVTVSDETVEKFCEAVRSIRTRTIKLVGNDKHGRRHTVRALLYGLISAVIIFIGVMYILPSRH